MNIKKAYQSHKWFCVESRKYLGYKKRYGEYYPVFGMVTDYTKTPFSTNNKVFGLKDVQKKWRYAYRFKDLLYWPIAWLKFMRLESVDW